MIHNKAGRAKDTSTNNDTPNQPGNSTLPKQKSRDSTPPSSRQSKRRRASESENYDMRDRKSVV